MNFKQIKPKLGLRRYNGFRYNGDCISFTKSLTDEILNYDYAYIQIDEEAKSFNIGFSKEKLDGVFKIRYSGSSPNISLSVKNMPHGRYIQSDDNKSIYIYSSN